MYTVTSFRGSMLDAARIAMVMNDYLALERARVNRRVCVFGFGLLAIVLGIIGIVTHRGPSNTSWLSVALCGVAPAWAWVEELRCATRLSRYLANLPGLTTQTVPSA
jgi:hypothetical protein